MCRLFLAPIFLDCGVTTLSTFLQALCVICLCSSHVCMGTYLQMAVDRSLLNCFEGVARGGSRCLLPVALLWHYIWSRCLGGHTVPLLTHPPCHEDVNVSLKLHSCTIKACKHTETTLKADSFHVLWSWTVCNLYSCIQKHLTAKLSFRKRRVQV